MDEAAPIQPMPTREEILAQAEASGNRAGLQDDQFRLESGAVVTFKPMSLWDTLEIQKEGGAPAHELAMRQPLLFLGLAAWRCAVVGGYEMPFRAFAADVHSSRMDELGAVVRPFLGKAQLPAPKSSG